MTAAEVMAQARRFAAEELGLKANAWFVLTPYLERLVDRAALYLEAGLPLHLRGPAGAGKTTLARYLAARRGRPVYTIYGNEAFTGFDLVGQATGYRQQSVVDNYIHNVVKRSTQVETLWTYGRMLRAIREGGTLIYARLREIRRARLAELGGNPHGGAGPGR